MGSVNTKCKRIFNAHIIFNGKDEIGGHGDDYEFLVAGL